MTATEFYEQGNELRKKGLWGAAINSYLEAERLDPDSPATEARLMLEDILNYRNTDLWNP
jgi:outer membrane protein assembly factor BamD (BamD/ComL family)